MHRLPSPTSRASFCHLDVHFHGFTKLGASMSISYQSLQISVASCLVGRCVSEPFHIDIHIHILVKGQSCGLLRDRRANAEWVHIEKSLSLRTANIDSNWTWSPTSTLVKQSPSMHKSSRLRYLELLWRRLWNFDGGSAFTKLKRE